MKYYTENELQNFRFEGAYIAETCAVNGIFEMILDNVTILPQNSCNRDIREMRANELKLKIREPEITAFVEEGYKVYDADGNLEEKKEDILIAAEDQAAKLKELEGCEIYSIEQETCFIFCSSLAPKLRLKDNASPLFIPNAKFVISPYSAETAPICASA